jgi:predicted HicB family RNase H-like nuclease
MTIDAAHYTISTKKVTVEDEELFEARIAELPDVREYAESQSEAYQLAIETIETSAELMAEMGREIPPPAHYDVDEEVYSGRVTLRVTGSLHRSLVESADREGTSLNSYITTILAFNQGSYTSARAVPSIVEMTRIKSCYWHPNWQSSGCFDIANSFMVDYFTLSKTPQLAVSYSASMLPVDDSVEIERLVK